MRMHFVRGTVLALILLLSLPGQRRPVLNDGEMHGDAPYLLEDGWTPLLNGKDLSGWHGQNPSRNEWLTTTGVLWDRLLGPTRLSAVPGPVPGGTILNGPTGRTTQLVTDDKFGDVEIYLEFMLAKGSNSGVSCGQTIHTRGAEFMMDVPHARQQMGSPVGLRHRAGQSETPPPK